MRLRVGRGSTYYTIRVAEPVSVNVKPFGTYDFGTTNFRTCARTLPLKPRGIIEHLQLTKPIFRQTAAGHFGRENLGFLWEQTDKAGY